MTPGAFRGCHAHLLVWMMIWLRPAPGYCRSLTNRMQPSSENEPWPNPSGFKRYVPAG